MPREATIIRRDHGAVMFSRNAETGWVNCSREDRSCP